MRISGLYRIRATLKQFPLIDSIHHFTLLPCDVDHIEFDHRAPIDAGETFGLHLRAVDKMGNLVYRGTGRSYSPLMATAADITIVETDELIAPGQLDPEVIVTPGIFVKRLVLTSEERKK